ncbi:hypothetical protein [Delftia acidovorans]|uniref:hypothetical protein n=1 Tax=Delftia acidovorans TaxID=80866 RepID=UPI001D0C45BE|nr:hypothetical protein [Delftia acidovorans]
MARITKAKAFCNDEVVYLAWEADGKIKACLGFMVMPVFLLHANVANRRMWQGQWDCPSRRGP